MKLNKEGALGTNPDHRAVEEDGERPQPCSLARTLDACSAVSMSLIICVLCAEVSNAFSLQSSTPVLSMLSVK